MNQCVNCGHENEKEDTRCSRCGCLIHQQMEKIDKRHSKKCPSCSRIIAKSFEACPYCHESVPAGRFFTDIEAGGLMLHKGHGGW